MDHLTGRVALIGGILLKIVWFCLWLQGRIYDPRERLSETLCHPGAICIDFSHAKTCSHIKPHRWILDTWTWHEGLFEICNKLIWIVIYVCLCVYIWCEKCSCRQCHRNESEYALHRTPTNNIIIQPYILPVNVMLGFYHCINKQENNQ